MASPNVELVRSIYAAWELGDFSDTGWAAPDLEYAQADGPAAGEWTGTASLTEQFRDFLSAWAGWSVRAEEFLEVDGERVLVPFHFSARGKRSGLELGQIWTRGATLFHVRDGEVTRLVQYFDRELAFEEAGVS